MGFFDKFSMPNPYKKQLKQPEVSPIIGQASTYKTLASFSLDVDLPKFTGDIPNAEIKSYEDFK